MSEKTDLLVLGKALEEHATLTRELKNLAAITGCLIDGKQGAWEDEAREILNKIKHMIP